MDCGDERDGIVTAGRRGLSGLYQSVRGAVLGGLFAPEEAQCGILLGGILFRPVSETVHVRAFQQCPVRDNFRDSHDHAGDDHCNNEGRHISATRRKPPCREMRLDSERDGLDCDHHC